MSTSFEAFEVQVPASEVLADTGKFTRTFPGPAVQVPNHVSNDHNFIANLALFIAQTDLLYPYDHACEDTISPVSNAIQCTWMSICQS
jgi:hypothetical protein